ncbi:MAG: hypothetical protein AMJ81_12590 [Phycisphaerae bacterium SM23_33]|nr:MAG: hypothetical protein AMJ81_12590 [Phycisphaerae bacterium SM23_33]
MVLFLAACVLASPAAGRDLKLLKVGEPDAHDIKSLVASVTAGCHSDQEKAIALWGYITRRHFFHWNPLEHPEGTTELGYVLDPIRIFNVYGMTICFQIQHTLAAMCEVAGLPARQRALPGHCVLEVWYDGDWHEFDAQYDCAHYCQEWDAGGPTRIVDTNTICGNPDRYIMNQQYPSTPFWQWDYLGGKFIAWGSKQYCRNTFYKSYIPTSGESYYAACRSWGHSMDLDLRRGERLTRYWDRLGRWYCPPEFYAPTTWYDFERGPHNFRLPKIHYVNGIQEYRPDWAAHQNNFLDGLYQGVNYVLQDGKVGPAGLGDCYVIFRMHSPYLIAGSPGTLTVAGDSHSGAILEADFHRANVGATNSVAVSTDNGLTWTTVWTNDTTGDCHLKLDITNQVEGTYGYLLRVRLLGEDVSEASVANLKLKNSLFMSPMPLPGIQAGTNRFKFSMKPQEAVFWIKPDLGSSPRYLDFFHEISNLSYSTSYPSHLSPGGGGKGYAVVKVAPPATWQIHWLTVAGSFSAANSPWTPPSDRAQILYKTNLDPAWRFAFKKPFDAGAHWRRERTCDIRLRQPAAECYVKFQLKKVSRCTLNTYRIFAHCTRPEPALQPGMVKITHTWFADGAAKSKTIIPSLEGDSYVVPAAGSNIVNRALIIEVANEQ